tara:strand:+ start:900 stop:1733 length:834 start_codon:yes stop_codon:yes gene_type:complete
MLLFNIGTLFKGEVVKRPSAKCKTPYVADVILEDGTDVLGHTAALGCCGLADKTANVLMTKVENSKNVCSHKIQLSIKYENNHKELIGIDPKLAERIVDESLKHNCIGTLKNLQSYKREVKMLNSRFDFAGVDADGNEFVLEVKNVPLADYVDCYEKERKNHDTSHCAYNEKISYFPDGYRKKQKDTVSPRALKHIQELQKLKETTNKRTILCYVIQRTDVSSFQPSNIDPIYKQAVIEAYQKGVEILPLVCKWTEDGNCYFVRDDLPINIPKQEIQ